MDFGMKIKACIFFHRKVKAGKNDFIHIFKASTFPTAFLK